MTVLEKSTKQILKDVEFSIYYDEHNDETQLFIGDQIFSTLSGDADDDTCQEVFDELYDIISVE